MLDNLPLASRQKIYFEQDETHQHNAQQVKHATGLFLWEHLKIFFLNMCCYPKRNLKSDKKSFKNILLIDL